MLPDNVPFIFLVDCKKISAMSILEIQRVQCYKRLGNDISGKSTLLLLSEDLFLKIRDKLQLQELS